MGILLCNVHVAEDFIVNRSLMVIESLRSNVFSGLTFLFTSVNLLTCGLSYPDSEPEKPEACSEVLRSKASKWIGIPTTASWESIESWLLATHKYPKRTQIIPAQCLEAQHHQVVCCSWWNSSPQAKQITHLEDSHIPKCSKWISWDRFICFTVSCCFQLLESLEFSKHGHHQMDNPLGLLPSSWDQQSSRRGQCSKCNHCSSRWCSPETPYPSGHFWF